MFETLLETGAVRTRSAAGTAMSLLVHVVAVAAAVAGTWNAGVAALAPDELAEDVVFTRPTPPPEVPRAAPQPALQPPVKGFQILVAPISIPATLPDIDLSLPITNDSDFTGRNVMGGRGNGVPGGRVLRVDSTATYSEAQVEKQAVQITGAGTPEYPGVMRDAGVDGHVTALFVIDASGRVEVASFKVIKASHPMFAEAVRVALPRMRFLPAEVAGVKVRQLVQLPFEFSIR